ncbi:MAG: hypothetical protein JWQ76_1803 [Ramlibacter sp.]|nr:hypothetical protein [Ramlibacter sp.]
MTEDELLAYVQAAANLLQLPLTEARAQAVALHLGRTAALARLLDAAPLAAEQEIAQIYCPAPFPPDLEA